MKLQYLSHSLALERPVLRITPDVTDHSLPGPAHQPVCSASVVWLCSPLPVKIVILVFAIGMSNLLADTGDFSRSSAFESVEAFVAAANAFQPAASKNDMADLFSVREPGQPEDAKTGSRITAQSIQSSVTLWTNDSLALVFTTAFPPTSATRSSVGVLFLLNRVKNSWRIADSQRFTATGKDAGVSAELTAGTGTGYHLGSDGMKPVVTVKESQGGRGYAYQLSASYAINAQKIKRIQLE